MSVDTTAVAGPCESMRERERAVWRATCDRERDRARGREREASAVTAYSSMYTEVVATSGRGGRGALALSGTGDSQGRSCGQCRCPGSGGGESHQDSCCASFIRVEGRW